MSNTNPDQQIGAGEGNSLTDLPDDNVPDIPGMQANNPLTGNMTRRYMLKLSAAATLYPLLAGCAPALAPAAPKADKTPAATTVTSPPGPGIEDKAIPKPTATPVKKEPAPKKPDIPDVLKRFSDVGLTVKQDGREWLVTPQEETRRQLALGDWYYGKEHNANEAAKAIMRFFREIRPGRTYKLIGDGIIDFTGKVTRQKFGANAELPNWIVGVYNRNESVFGGGACWAVSTLGAAHNDFNAEVRKAGFGFDLLDNAGNPIHAHSYRSYIPMRYWDTPAMWHTLEDHSGHTILQNKDGNAIGDYKVQVDPKTVDYFAQQGFSVTFRQEILFHQGKKPAKEIPREETSFMTAHVIMVLTPLIGRSDSRNQ